jgi:flagellar biosynthetic protein FliQ
MTTEYALDVAQRTFLIGVTVALPVVGIGMIVGVAVAIFQAATQIQEQSLSFVPKLAGMGVALVVFGPWIAEKISHFTITMIQSIATLGG